MKKRLPVFLGLLGLVILLLAGALLAGRAFGVPGLGATATPDPCLPANIGAPVNKIHALMREFYDASALVSQTPMDKLPLVIPSLQEIRRKAQDQAVPACVEKLKSLQIAHMNLVINTSMAFLNKADPDTLVQGIAQSAKANEDYRREMARLLGVTYTPPEQKATATAAPK
jgi:hypothetical protein